MPLALLWSGVVTGGRYNDSFVVWNKNTKPQHVFRQLSGTRWETIFTAEVWKPVWTVGTPRGFFNFFNFFNFFTVVNISNFVRGVRVVTQRAQRGI